MSARWRYILIAIAVVAAGGGIWLTWFAKTLGPRMRARVVTALEQRFDADVQLKHLDVSFLPQPHIEGEGLAIRHKGWPDAAPLIYIRRFTASADWQTLIARRNHVKRVRLYGLEIHIPPRGASAFKETFSRGEEVESGEPGHDETHLQFTIDTIQADGTSLQIAPKTPGKDPLEFDIKKLMLHSVGPGKAMAFTAKLTNAKPPGLIDSRGYFGPWQRDDPRATPVSGNYTFKNANLGVFKGISGTLSSTGSYSGVLQHIETSGTTDTPDFSLKRGGNDVHLRTKFHAIVNGTDGNTILDPVEAAFLQSQFTCRGGVIREPGAKGKTVSLDAVAQRARMEDILSLVVGEKQPFLTGAVNFQSKIVIPPGPADVIDKLKLNGRFHVDSAMFTNPNVEKRLVILSDRARGISKDEQQDLEQRNAQQIVASDFRGKFKLNGGVASFSTLSYQVPGAAVHLSGSYNLRSRRIDMHGVFRMQATLSETQSGVKSWLLKPFNKLFESDGAGFEVPLDITGTKNHPILALDIFHHEITLQ
jgi:hypothetical protein